MNQMNVINCSDFILKIDGSVRFEQVFPDTFTISFMNINYFYIYIYKRKLKSGIIA